MSENNVRYSHPKYCLERYIIDTPSEIPIPKLNVTNDDAIKHKKNVLPAKSVTMKRTRTVIVDNQPKLEAEHTPNYNTTHCRTSCTPTCYFLKIKWMLGFS